MSAGIAAYGTWLPRYRLRPAEVAEAWSTRAAGSARVVAGFDEDSTTAGVAAARAATVAGLGAPAAVLLATTSPVYADRTNATAVHAALALDPQVPATDLGAAARSGIGALTWGAMHPGLAVLADVRTGRPGSVDEREGGDGAAAFLFADEEHGVLARVRGRASATSEFLDRWAAPGERAGHQWEERFGLERYEPLVREVAGRVLAAAALDRADHVVLVSPNSAVRRRAGTLVRGRLSTGGSPIGHAGCADAGLALAAVLDTAGPGETVLVLSAADGADALLLETTDLLPARRQPVPVAEQLDGGVDVPYARYLAWRGFLDPEPPRRPDPAQPAAPPSARGVAWKFALTGSSCRVCGFRQLPPVRICRRCGAVDEMTAWSAAAGRAMGTVATFTVDRLAFSPSPPLVAAVVDFDGGGRFTFEVADVDVARLRVGARADVVFRRLYTADGVADYFWKARLVPGDEPGGDA